LVLSGDDLLVLVGGSGGVAGDFFRIEALAEEIGERRLSGGSCCESEKGQGEIGEEAGHRVC
jgi:hypothetical protein